MTDTLRISPDITLPVDTITDTMALFGTRGSGKSSTAVVIVEEAHALGLPVVIIDPKGDWWGLRSSASGGKGLPFIIFGGDHADVPLEPTAGAVLADLIVDQRPNAVLDISEMSKTKQRTFATDFAERLYQRNRDAILVVVDEADMIIPQRASANDARLVGAWDNIAKRGRGRGLGMIVLTQRPQDVAKSVLDEMHSLIVMAMMGPRAVKAVKDWIVDHDSVEGSRTNEVLGSLKRLKPGEGWVWAPQHDMLERTQVRRIKTFDSHETPKPGVVRKQPKAMAEIDLDAIKQAIADTVEKAEANDPKALKAKVVSLQRELIEVRGELLAWQEAEPEVHQVDIVEIPVLGEEDREALAEIRDLINRVVEEVSVPLAEQRTEPVRPPAPASAPERPQQQPRKAVVPVSPASSNGSGEVRLGVPERKVLTVLANHGPCSTAKIAMLAGYSAKSSSVDTAIAKLRKVGYVTPGMPVEATDEGIEWLGDYEHLPSGAELVAYWRNQFGEPGRKVLDVVIDAYPTVLSAREVGERAGYSPTSSSVDTVAAKLRRAGVLDGWTLNEDLAGALA